MKKICALLVLISMLLSLSVSMYADDVNLFSDPGFEKGEPVQVLGSWEAWGPGVAVEITDLDAFKGTKSLLTTAPGWGGPAIDISETLIAKGAGMYKFSTNLKAADEDASMYFYLYLTYKDLSEHNTFLAGTQTEKNVTTGKWTTLTSPEIDIPAGITSARLIAVNASKAQRSFYMDEVSMTKAGLTSLPTSSTSSSVSSSKSSSVASSSSKSSSAQVSSTQSSKEESSQVISSEAESMSESSMESKDTSMEASKEEMESSDSAVKDESSNNTTMIIVIIALGLIGLAVAAYFIVQNKRKKIA